MASVTPENIAVSTHSRPKAAGLCRHFEVWDLFGFQLTAARRRLDWFLLTGLGSEFVSTHSRPKAAGCCTDTRPKPASRFNSQPPEGGWTVTKPRRFPKSQFQLTAARRRLENDRLQRVLHYRVSTHSRPKAAGPDNVQTWRSYAFQLTAARRRLDSTSQVATASSSVSTHSRPKAAGDAHTKIYFFSLVSTHSRPKAAGQRLETGLPSADVSTHSRPKAAGWRN